MIQTYSVITLLTSLSVTISHLLEELWLRFAVEILLPVITEDDSFKLILEIKYAQNSASMLKALNHLL